jgi:2-haloacid dehalogenase
VKADEICFLSSNAWDAVGGAAFGYRVAWVNRYKQPRERLPAQPQAEIATLRELPALLGL